MSITNRSRHATAAENAQASALHAASLTHTTLPHAKALGINVWEIQYLAETLATYVGIDRQDPEDYLELLLHMAHYVLFAVEAEYLKIERAPRAERPLFPWWKRLMRLDRAEQARQLDKRASELLREIEGLRRTVDGARDGYYAAPIYSDARDMIANARRKYARLRETAMKLGHWTEGRWDDGEEETHLV